MKTLTNTEMMTFFCLADKYNALHKCRGLTFDSDYDDDIAALLSDVGTQYDDGGDSVFWVLDYHYIERDGENWTVEKMDGQTEDQIASYAIASYYTNDLLLPNSLVSFGLDHLVIDNLVIADKNYVGMCKIWRQVYYNGSTDVQSDWVKDDNFVDMFFSDYAGAQKYVNEYYHGKSSYDGFSPSQIMSHNQYAGDDLYIVEASQ
jgi:hypothetical protein